MCIGDAGDDTLHAHEQRTICDVALQEFPAHSFAVHTNGDGIAWAVLAPREASERLLRFTICRIDPCVMVLVEDPHARRQIRSLPSIDDALAFVRIASDQALLAAAGVGAPSLQ